MVYLIWGLWGLVFLGTLAYCLNEIRKSKKAEREFNAKWGNS